MAAASLTASTASAAAPLTNASLEDREEGKGKWVLSGGMVGSESVERVGGWFGDEHMLLVMAIQFTHSLCPKEVGEPFFGDILCLCHNCHRYGSGTKASRGRERIEVLGAHFSFCGCHSIIGSIFHFPIHSS